MAADIGTGVATNVTNAIIGQLFQQLKDVMELEENLQLLNTEFARMNEWLHHIQTQFERQQKKLPEVVERCLERMKDALEDATALIHRVNRQRGRCLGCCLLCFPKIPEEIRVWKTRFGELFQQLESALSIAASTQQIVESAQPQAEVLLQPLPDSGFVGSGIESAHKQLLTWLNEPHPQGRVIGVSGMAGVGKTSLLQLIYNKFCEKKVSSSFDFIIWFTVSQNYKIESLQDTIAESVGLNFKVAASIDQKKMKLYAFLENKRFLLILDDIWSPIDLNQVGVNFGHNSSSRVLISSRHRDVVETMAANEYCMMIRPLSSDEGWELFRRKAFTNGAVPDNLQAIAREVASECKGLPLAINAVAAALARKKTADEWRRALVLMKSVDPSFPSTHRTINAELYQRLRWSYDDLPNNLKMCFLYCAAFPEDAEIVVETMVEMWTAESLVPQRGKTYFMDVGRECIDALVDRCLVEYVNGETEKITVHDVLRDMAIHIGQGEEKWLFEVSQHLKKFPSEEETRDRERISVVDNEISGLPADLKCPTLVSLALSKNKRLKEIPEGFLVNAMSLKVLDLSNTSIQVLPTSVAQLVKLEFLNLRGCYRLKYLPDSICNLSHLQFLNLERCVKLNSLPDTIGQLKNLKHLKFSGGEAQRIPRLISEVTSLNKLVLPKSSTPVNVEDLTNLSNLIELDARVKPKTKGGSMNAWSEMKKLILHFEWVEDENRDDAALDILPQSMQKLQSLHLYDFQGVILPNCICLFQNLKNLCLTSCRVLKGLPALETGSDAASGGFPLLERLELYSIDSLESIVWNQGTMLQLQILQIENCGSLQSIVWNEGKMSKLQVLHISKCRVLKTFRMEELPNLRDVSVSHCDKVELFTVSGGFPMLEALTLHHLPSLQRVAGPSGFPMLEALTLHHLPNLESIAGPFMWSEEKMPKLQSLYIKNCLLFRRLSIENFPNLKQITIIHCPELEIEIDNLPMLERLILANLEKVESIARSSSVWNEKTMSKLQILRIINCPLLRKLPMEMDKLCNLREIVGKLDWWERLVWEDENVKTKLSQLFINSKKK